MGLKSVSDLALHHCFSERDSRPLAPVLNQDHLQEITDFDDLKRKLKELPSGMKLNIVVE